MREITAGATSQSVYFVIRDTRSTTDGRLTGLVYNASGLEASYARNGGARTAITLATLASPSAAWSTGGFVEVDATHMPGLYRLDLPDAAIAAGVPSVIVTVRGAANMAQEDLEIQLTAVDFQDAVKMGVQNLGVVDSGTAQAGSSSSITLRAGASATTDKYKGLFVYIDGGTGKGQIGFVTAYNGSTKVATVNAWSAGTAPDSTSTYSIIGF